MATAGPPSVHDVVQGNPYLRRPAVPSGPSGSVVPAKRLAGGGSSLPAKVARLGGDPNSDLRQMMMDDDDPYPSRGAPSPSPPPPEPAKKAPPLAKPPVITKKPAILSKPPPADLRKLGSGSATKRPAASSSKPAPNGLRPPPKTGAPSASAGSTLRPGSVKADPSTLSPANKLAPASTVQHLLKKPGPPKLNLAKRQAPKQDSLFMPTKRKVRHAFATMPTPLSPQAAADPTSCLCLAGSRASWAQLHRRWAVHQARRCADERARAVQRYGQERVGPGGALGRLATTVWVGCAPRPALRSA
jgi:hypothetical protein